MSFDYIVGLSQGFVVEITLLLIFLLVRKLKSIDWNVKFNIFNLSMDSKIIALGWVNHIFAIIALCLPASYLYFVEFHQPLNKVSVIVITFFCILFVKFLDDAIDSIFLLRKAYRLVGRNKQETSALDKPE